MDASEFTVAGFQMVHLILAFLISATFVFVLYWLWTWPCGSSSDDCEGCEPKKCRTVLPTQRITPLYALELEPGIVVLQSEDGEFFRILREYEAADRTGKGSHSPEPASPGPENSYIPSYTRAHYQNKPSAPSLMSFEDSQSLMGADSYGDAGQWTPINTVRRP